MKVALTSDLHLTDPSLHPERYHALQDILTQMMAEEVQTLVIAGDLFDSTLRDFQAFEEICGNKDFSEFEIFVIPGNHDAFLNQAAVALRNLRVFEEPVIYQLGPKGMQFLFLPYKERTTMGDQIQSLSHQLSPFQWILIGHGDWFKSYQEVNPLETGVFMPLTEKDIQRYQPLRTFLGHIHKPYDGDRIYYLGSPCSLDISESGLRRYLLFDTESMKIEKRYVNTDQIYFDEVIVVLPFQDEEGYIRDWAQHTIEGWGINPEHKEKVNLRLRARGYSADRNRVAEILKECFEDFQFYKDEAPDVTGVQFANDPERRYIAMKVEEQLREIEWPECLDEPSGDEILLAALETIYGG